MSTGSSQEFILATGTELGSDEPLRSLLPRLVHSLAAHFQASHAVLVLPAEEGYRVACSWGEPGPQGDAVELCAAQALTGDRRQHDVIAAATMMSGARISRVARTAELDRRRVPAPRDDRRERPAYGDRKSPRVRRASSLRMERV